MRELGTKKLLTPRLLLRRFRPGDAQDVYDGWAGSAAACRHNSWGPHHSPEETAALVEAWARVAGEPGVYNWAVEYMGRVVGNVHLYNVDHYTQCAVLGYTIAELYWGRGFATEAARAVLAFGFGEMGLNRIEATHDVSNLASGKVLHKLGMRFEGRLRQAGRTKDTGFEDRLLYARLAEDYSA